MDLIRQQSNIYLSRDNMAMKFLVVSLLVVGCALAEDAPYPPSGSRPQGALLVLPTEVGSPSASQLAPQFSAPQYLAPRPQNEEAENLQKGSENIMERLNQEQGSAAGSYYVYLPDGRLQRVQYITAPLRQPSPTSNQNDNLQNSQNFQNSKTLQFNQQDAQVTGKLQAFNEEPKQSQSSEQYVQQPQTSHQYQPTLYNQYLQVANSEFSQQQARAQNQLQSASGQFRQQPSSNQYNQEAASNQHSQQVPSGAARQEKAKPEKLSQPQQQQYPQNLPQQSSGLSEQYSKIAVQGANNNENAAFAEQQQLYQLQQQNQLQLQQQQYLQQVQYLQQPQYVQQTQYLEQPLTANYVASVQYTEVQPIANPIYSYSPASLIRIVRYAPKYQ